MKFWSGQQNTEVLGEKAQERKCQKPAVQQTTEEEEKNTIEVRLLLKSKGDIA